MNCEVCGVPCAVCSVQCDSGMLETTVCGLGAAFAPNMAVYSCLMFFTAMGQVRPGDRGSVEVTLYSGLCTMSIDEVSLAAMSLSRLVCSSAVSCWQSRLWGPARESSVGSSSSSSSWPGRSSWLCWPGGSGAVCIDMCVMYYV